MKKKILTFLKNKNIFKIFYFIKNPKIIRIIQILYYNLFSGPKSIKIHITSFCNYDCIYCYSDSTRKTLSFYDWKKIIKQGYNMGIDSLEISGGEPFTYNRLYELLKYCELKNLNVIIYTNGSLIDNNWLIKLSKLKNKLIISIKYSSKKDYEDSTLSKFKLNHIEKIIKNLVRLKIPVITLTTISKTNINNLKKILNKSVKLGTFPLIERYQPVKDKKVNKKLLISKKEWSNSIKLIKKIYINHKNLIKSVGIIQGNICSCYKTQISIMQNGEILPCQFLPLTESLGNISNSNMYEIWAIFKRKRKNWLKIPRKCIKCKNKYICRGGCNTYRFYCNNYHDKDQLCQNNILPTYGHCAISVIRSLKKKKLTNKTLNKLK
jgi:radical SAM protein with 4Fe4S-binding SPASM domain